MRYIEPPRSLADYDVHLSNFHGTLVYNMGNFQAEHDEQHARAERGTLGEHAEVWTPHTHVVTQDTYREAWATAYWRARDAGHSSSDSLSHAADETSKMLDALED